LAWRRIFVNMLAYILAVLVGTGSVGLYIAAFFFPEIHRKQDFIWSGVGCFYALFLWVYAHQVTGGILVGQTTSVILLGWFAWQTFQLRRQLAPLDRAAAIANAVQLPNRQGTTKPAPPKPASPTPAAMPSATTVSTTAPAAQVKQSIDKPPTTVAPKPASIDKKTTPVTTKPTSIDLPASAPEQIPLADVKIPPASVKAAPPVANQPVESSPPPPPTPTTPNPETEEDRAWIKLEVKPDPARSKPLGTPAQPPTPLLSAATNTDAPPVQSRPQTDAKSQIPTQTLPTAKVELEEPN
jgi:hypothetical protein